MSHSGARIPTLKPGAAQRLSEFLAKSVALPNAPPLFLGVSNARETLWGDQAGNVNYSDSKSSQVTEDTVTELFLQTKLVTCVAALQLVDRGLVSLDSPEDVEKHLPELSTLGVLLGYDVKGAPLVIPPEQKITLRMLLSHTAGFVYDRAMTLLTKWYEDNPRQPLLGSDTTISNFATPLIYDPGTQWRYSTSIDWAGKLVERISGLNLEACGITSFTFFPTDEVKSRKMTMCFREEDGTIRADPDTFGLDRPTDPTQVSRDFLSGGGGLFGTQKDYLALLRGVLQSDPRYEAERGGEKALLSPDSYAELFKGCVKTKQGLALLGEFVERPHYFNPPANSRNVEHSVGFLLNLEDFNGGRKAGSGTWSGAVKTQYWIDPTSGIVAICGTQLLPASPDPWFETYKAFEKAVYAELE